jgi:hypothetical protein
MWTVDRLLRALVYLMPGDREGLRQLVFMKFMDSLLTGPELVLQVSSTGGGR